MYCTLLPRMTWCSQRDGLARRCRLRSSQVESVVRRTVGPALTHRPQPSVSLVVCHRRVTWLRIIGLSKQCRTSQQDQNLMMRLVTIRDDPVATVTSHQRGARLVTIPDPIRAMTSRGMNTLVNTGGLYCWQFAESYSLSSSSLNLFSGYSTRGQFSPAVSSLNWLR